MPIADRNAGAEVRSVALVSLPRPAVIKVPMPGGQTRPKR